MGIVLHQLHYCFLFPKTFNSQLQMHSTVPNFLFFNTQVKVITSFPHSQVSPYNFSQCTKESRNPLQRFSWRHHPRPVVASSSTSLCASRKGSFGCLLVQFVDMSIQRFDTFLLQFCNVSVCVNGEFLECFRVGETFNEYFLSPSYKWICGWKGDTLVIR